ncbi:vacuolar membrane-associated protein Iml1p [Trichomonascus vanleenenianus]|uniref:GTPase-activating protein IML1 n=1 Tax=Trichomonascus vanleenenianus TaxID=2268995 RepID=UPI003EC9E92E
MSLIPNARNGDIAQLVTLEGRRSKRLFFVVKDLSEKTAKQLPNVQISVLSGNLFSLLDIPPRSKVQVRLRERSSVEADLVEIHFKDTYLTRADMWRISSSFIGKCFYSSQKITYLDCVRCQVNEIYRKGRKVLSAYIGPNTKFVYRSESARTIYFIQMSSEMWHFEENGEVMFHKLINSFLPEVFKRWREQGAHHVVTIVLFTSVDISGSDVPLDHGERGKNTKDYFRVVVDQVHISRWSDIMAALRHEFTRFAKDVQQQSSGEIEGKLLPAVKGNLMEAISLATTMVTSKFLDRDLRQTNSQVIIVTPGTGIFDVDYDLLYQTSIKLLSIEISIDLVCLSRPPLHVTPLFRFKDKSNEVVNCVPSWLDISFWKSTERYAKQWIPRCKIYEIQMMGVMENEISAISIDLLPQVHSKYALEKMMEQYDGNVFKPKAASLVMSNEAAMAPMLLYPKQSSEALANFNSSLRSVSKSIPASAIISSPATPRMNNEANEAFSQPSTTAALLNNAINPPRSKMSALASLLSLTTMGKRHSSGTLPKKPTPPSTPSSPSSDRSPTTVTSRSPSTNNLTAAFGTFLSSSTAQAEDDSTKITERLEEAPAGNVATTRTPRQAIPNQRSHPNLSMAGPPPQISKLARPPFINRHSSDKLSVSPQASFTTINDDIDSNNYIWVTIPNPSNVEESEVQNISNYGRWKNVFPAAVKRRAVKWRSLKSPASLPLASEIFPSVEEFEKNYTFQIYDVALDADKEDHMTPGDLMAEMVAMRLNMGFQVVVGERVSRVETQRRPGGNSALIVQTIPEDYRGIRIYMTRSNYIHRLACDHYGTINVQLYKKTDLELSDFTRTYHPMVQTKYEDAYQPAAGNFFDPSVRKVNWNQVDQLLAGYEDVMPENSKMFKIRFVLIPTDIPRNNPIMGTSEALSPEEIRLEGLRRVVLQLHKGTYLTREERLRKSRTKKESKPPEIKFYTGELGDFFESVLENYRNYYEDPSSTGGGRKQKLFVNETMNRNMMTLSQLAAELQGEKGVRLVDRRWHWKLHRNCFVGQELVEWLLDNFTDIETAEDAVEYGNELMEKGLFHHVDNRHSFLDGHYFYQLNKEYVKPAAPQAATDKLQSWFTAKKAPAGGSTAGGSTTGTANNDGAASTNSTIRYRSSTSLAELGNALGGMSISSNTTTTNNTNNNTNNNTSSNKTPSTHRRKNSSGVQSVISQESISKESNSQPAPLTSINDTESAKTATINSAQYPHEKELPKLLISRAMKYDIDPGKRSKRHEYLTLHVDRVHNPENAFHLRMEWVDATPKLIEEAIVSLGRTGERYGMKLVQVPIDEISSLPNGNPFCSLVRTRLGNKLNYVPPPDPKFSEIGSPLDDDPLFYQKYVLKRMGFVLDTVHAGSLIKADMEILYSWGRPFYNYSQYIHKTGIVLAQIVENNDILLITNTLHISRVTTSHSQSSTSDQQQSPVDKKPWMSFSQHNKPRYRNQNLGVGIADAEKIMFSVKDLCEKEEYYRRIIKEANKLYIKQKTSCGEEELIGLTPDEEELSSKIHDE